MKVKVLRWQCGPKDDDEHEDKIYDWFEGWAPYSNLHPISNQSRIWEDGRLNLFEHVCAGCRDKPNHSGNERTIGQTWPFLDDRGGRNDSRSPPRRQESRSPPRSHDYCSYWRYCGWYRTTMWNIFFGGISPTIFLESTCHIFSSKQFAHPYLRPLEFPKLCTYTSMCTVMCEYRSCTDQVLASCPGALGNDRLIPTPPQSTSTYLAINRNKLKLKFTKTYTVIMLVHLATSKSEMGKQ